MMKIFSIAVLLAVVHGSTAQEITLDSLMATALRTHPKIIAASYRLSEKQALRKSSFDLPRTDISVTAGQYNSYYNGDRNVTISQRIPFPGTFIRQRKLNSSGISQAKAAEDVARHEVAFELLSAFNSLMYLQEIGKILREEDSLMSRMVRVAELQYRVGETALVAKTSIETTAMEIKNSLQRNEADIEIQTSHLKMMCGCEFRTVQGELDKYAPSPATAGGNVHREVKSLEAQMSVDEKRLEVARAFPEIIVGYFNQSLVGFHNVTGSDQYYGRGTRFDGFLVGLSIPLWMPAHAARISSASYRAEASAEDLKQFDLEYDQRLRNELAGMQKNEKSLDYFQGTALVNAMLLRKNSALAFEKGDADYRSFLLGIQQALRIREDYFRTLYEFNQNVITINFLNGNSF
jgi:heavy metal efflux system protein